MNSFLVHLYRLRLHHERGKKPQTFQTFLCNLKGQKIIITDIQAEERNKRKLQRKKQRKCEDSGSQPYLVFYYVG
jgi:hypothetical protein